ncbi:MAG: iron-containing alcohol dehydrogenase [Bacteroidales bacterium]
MKNFTFYNPTRIEFGKGKEEYIGQYISEYSLKKVLIVYGSDRVKKSGLFNTVTKSLSEKGINYEELGGVISNPLLSKVYEGIELAKTTKVDAILGIGGASVLDTSKSIAAGAVYEGDVWDLFTFKAQSNQALRIFSIMTLAASGSEMNNYAVVTNEKTKQKMSIISSATFPTVSVVNPELQATVTKEYLAYSAADIFAHSLDMYLTATYLPEYIAGYVENILRIVIRTTNVLLEDAANYDVRGEFAWAATNALNLTTFCGIENNRFDTHFIEHTMSAEYNIAHGAGLSIIVPAWMKWQKNLLPERFARFAKEIFNAPTADKGIEALKSWYTKIGAPVTLKEGNIPEEGIDMMVEKLFTAAKMMGADALYSKQMLNAVFNNAK